MRKTNKTTGKNKMKEILISEIKKTAKETNKSENEVITAMQGILAAKNDMKNLQILCDLKWENINA